MAMRMRKMRIHADDAYIYKANKRIYADADAMRMMRIAKNCRMAIPNTNTRALEDENTRALDHFSSRALEH